MGSKSKTLNDLFLHTLKDIHYAERHVGKALTRLSKATETEELKLAFDQHREETYTQVERLEQIFELLGKKVQGEPCDTIQGLIEETKDIIDDFEDSAALDAALIGAARAIEHYQIARYGSLKTWATQLGLNPIATLVEETLGEQTKALAHLDALAEKLNAAPTPPETGAEPVPQAETPHENPVQEAPAETAPHA